MLALSPLRTSNADDQRGDAAGGFSDPFLEDEVDFLDRIDFSGIFEGFGLDNIGALPELPAAADPCDILGDFSAGGEEQGKGPQERKEEKDVMTETTASPTSPTPLSIRGRKPEAAGAAKSSHGKKKVKVDWTPELHRRFVQAVEQLGVDKAVPSRVLEIMGIDNLTRHNVASHLQKYRSHRKHLLAREAEAASWSHRRQVRTATPCGVSSVTKKGNSSSWLSPTLGFPPPPLRPSFRPLHVWGHPTVDHCPPLVPAMWPGNAITLQSPAPQWPHQPPNYIAYWQPHYQLEGSREGWGPSALFSATPCLPQPLPAIRLAPPPVTGVPPHPMYRPPHWVPPLKKHPGLQPELSAYPSKESIDEAIGGVLAKPWLPLPLGLKPPSTESVLVELQRQGVSKVPPSACNSEGN